MRIQLTLSKKVNITPMILTFGIKQEQKQETHTRISWCHVMGQRFIIHRLRLLLSQHPSPMMI